MGGRHNDKETIRSTGTQAPAAHRQRVYATIYLQQSVFTTTCDPAVLQVPADAFQLHTVGDRNLTRKNAAANEISGPLAGQSITQS